MTIPFKEWFSLDASNIDEVDEAIPEIHITFPRGFSGPLDDVRADDCKTRVRFSAYRSELVVAFDYGAGQASMLIGHKLYRGHCSERSDGRWQFEINDGFMDADANNIEEE